MLTDAKKRWFIGLAIAGGCLAALVVVQLLPGAPKFQRKTMELWVLELVGPSAEGRAEASKVITITGTNAVPELVRLLEKRDSIFRRQMWSWWQKVPARFKGRGARFQSPNAAEVRYAAAKALGLLGPEAVAAAPALGRAMRSKESSVRFAAALALGRTGEAGLPELVRALADKDLNIRYVAVHGLGEACSETNVATLALLKTVGEGEPPLSVWAGASLKKLGTNVVPLLLRDMEQGDSETRQRAVKVVAALRPPRQMVLPALLKMAQEADAGCRIEATRALAGMSLPNPPIVNALVVALKDPEPGARIAAAMGLGQVRLQPKAAVPALIGSLMDSSSRVRESAARSLGALGAASVQSVPDLENLSHDPEPTVREAAADAVKKIKAAEAKEAARQMSGSNTR